MLAKCANPPCCSSFHSLEDGMLFRVEAEFNAGDVRKTEYFWLCSRCSETMTLYLDENASVQPLPFATFAQCTVDMVHFKPVKRSHGLLLSCIHAWRGNHMA